MSDEFAGCISDELREAFLQLPLYYDNGQKMFDAMNDALVHHGYSFNEDAHKIEWTDAVKESGKGTFPIGVRDSDGNKCDEPVWVMFCTTSDGQVELQPLFGKSHPLGL